MSDDKWSDQSEGKELGSLAQSARRTSLKQARTILIVVGVLTALMNVFMFVNAEAEVRKAFEDEKRKLGPGMVFDEAEIKKTSESALQVTRLIYGGTVFLGVLFVCLGLAVYRAPVVCTVTGLVLYLAANAIFAALDPLNLVRGIIVRVIIIVAMVKAVQAALAYEREAKAEREARLGETNDPVAL
ncbi:MAG: hypothetical protein JWO38_5436 [Gemmataceae bacterium]|nr:hypothetical protein [Gemmataceae bacterium]